MITFCTLFDSNYMDKGLTLYKSLIQNSKNFKLFIFCFDNQSYRILKDIELKFVEVIHHSKIENEELLKIKKQRSKAEYYWTCTPIIIEYVLKKYDVEHCIYIDSDLYFFNDPQILLKEIIESNANIVITEHRFTASRKDRRLCKRSGKYCVEFNYFDRSDNAANALKWWRERCLEWCYHLYEPDRMGDQKYLEKFPKLFNGVHELQYLGGGVAPWNLNQYELADYNNGYIRFKVKKTGEVFFLIFFHFQNIKYLSKNIVNVSSGTHSKKIKDAIYRPYLQAIEKSRKELRKYGLVFNVRKIYSSNKLLAFLQSNILRFKINSISDIYILNQFRK